MMITEGDNPDQLVELVLDVLENPDTADCNALLLAANAFIDFLDTASLPDTHLLPHARVLAVAAMEWAVFQRDLTPLKNAFRACYSAYTAA
jgi:hypothetical protein